MNTGQLIKIFIILLTFTICACERPDKKKTKLTYENGIQKVEIQILSGNDYLEYDKPTKMNFVLTNIELKTFSVNGIGIRVIETKNGIMKTEINVLTDYLKTDTLDVKVRFGKKPGENYEFNIPMKTDS